MKVYEVDFYDPENGATIARLSELNKPGEAEALPANEEVDEMIEKVKDTETVIVIEWFLEADPMFIDGDFCNFGRFRFEETSWINWLRLYHGGGTEHIVEITTGGQRK